jgi:hypothetical protein
MTNTRLIFTTTIMVLLAMPAYSSYDKGKEEANEEQRHQRVPPVPSAPPKEAQDGAQFYDAGFLKEIIRNPKLSNVRMTEFSTSRCLELGLSHMEVRGLIKMLTGLETLEARGLEFYDSWESQPSSDYVNREITTLFGCLLQNSPNLKKLDLCGSKGLRHDNGAYQFIKSVGKFNMLESINVMGTDISNLPLISLAKTFSTMSSLTEVHMSMPFRWSNLSGMVKAPVINWRSTATSVALAFATTYCLKSALIVGKLPALLRLTKTGAALASSIPALCIGVVMDLRGEQGPEYSLVMDSLAIIPNLEKLHLHLSGLRTFEDWTRHNILKKRQAANAQLPELKAINIMFE